MARFDEKKKKLDGKLMKKSNITKIKQYSGAHFFSLIIKYDKIYLKFI